ncbi:MAG: hypothetical protein PQJ28_03545, partial [Spirochaetales bacterium]|nr:hypothetical protein [Spirochaetales bacterium]
MLELIAIITIIILFALFLKWRGKTGTPTGEKEKVSEKLSPEGIVGKSSFILTTRKSTVPKADLSGKMDIEVPLEY